MKWNMHGEGGTVGMDALKGGGIEMQYALQSRMHLRAGHTRGEDELGGEDTL